MTPYRQDLKAYQKSTFTQSLVLRNEDNENITLSEGEKIIFGVKAAGFDTKYLIRKELTNDNYVSSAKGFLLTLTSQDTDIRPGVYYYDIALQKSGGELELIEKKSEFVVEPSIAR